MRNRISDPVDELKKLTAKCPMCAGELLEFITLLYQIKDDLKTRLAAANYRRVKQGTYELNPFRRTFIYRLGDGPCCIRFRWKRAVVADLDVLC